jgi:hypothetical protein
VTDKSIVTVDALTVNRSHGEGSHAAAIGEGGEGGELGGGAGAWGGVEFPSSPSGVSSLPMRQPNKVEEQAPTATLRACRRDTEVAIKRLATAERGGIVSS